MQLFKEEYDASGNTRSFSEQVQISLDKYPGRFWTSNSVPTLGECRGKIVILDNFAGGVIGIDWGSIALEDHWSTGKDDKWNYVSNHLKKKTYPHHSLNNKVCKQIVQFSPAFHTST